MRAHEISGPLLLAAAVSSAPWIGTRRTYRAWAQRDDDPLPPPQNDEATRRRDAERHPPSPRGSTVADKRGALAASHHTDAHAVAIDAVLTGTGRRTREVRRQGRRPGVREAALRCACPGSRRRRYHGPDGLSLTTPTTAAIRRRLRAGRRRRRLARAPHLRLDASAPHVRRVESPAGLGSERLPRRTTPRVILRASASGLVVIAETAHDRPAAADARCTHRPLRRART